MKDKSKFTKEVRQALADYMRAEGCSCCRNQDDWEKAKTRLMVLLRVPKFSDRSGYNYHKFATKKN